MLPTTKKHYLHLFKDWIIVVLIGFYGSIPFWILETTVVCTALKRSFSCPKENFLVNWNQEMLEVLKYNQSLAWRIRCCLTLGICGLFYVILEVFNVVFDIIILYRWFKVVILLNWYSRSFWNTGWCSLVSLNQFLFRISISL